SGIGELTPKVDGRQGTPSRQGDNLLRLGDEEWASVDEQRADTLLSECSKCRVDFTFCTGFEDNELLSQRACRYLRVCREGLGPWIKRVDKNGNYSGFRHQLSDQSKLLRAQRSQQTGNASHISARSAETDDQPQLNRVVAHVEHDGNFRGRPL